MPRQTRRLFPRELAPRIRGIVERMGAQASVQMHLAVDAFSDSDANIAAALPDMDDVMDDLQKELFRTIFAAGAPDEGSLQSAVQVAFVGRDYERAADHAVTIGRWVQFMVTGPHPGRRSHERRRPLRTGLHYQRFWKRLRTKIAIPFISISRTSSITIVAAASVRNSSCGRDSHW